MKQSGEAVVYPQHCFSDKLNSIIRVVSQLTAVSACWLIQHDQVSVSESDPCQLKSCYTPDNWQHFDITSLSSLFLHQPADAVSHIPANQIKSSPVEAKSWVTLPVVCSTPPSYVIVCALNQAAYDRNINDTLLMARDSLKAMHSPSVIDVSHQQMLEEISQAAQTGGWLYRASRQEFE